MIWRQLTFSSRLRLVVLCIARSASKAWRGMKPGESRGLCPCRGQCAPARFRYRIVRKLFLSRRSGETMVEMIYQAQLAALVDGAAGGTIHHPSGRWRSQQRRNLATERVGDCSSFGAQFLKAPSSAASYPPVATAGARPPAERYWRKLARRQISNRSHGGSNLVSDAATRILKIRDQRLASEIGRLRQKI